MMKTKPLAILLAGVLTAGLASAAAADPLTRVVHVRADSANGTGHYPIPGSAGPWVNLAGGPSAAVENFHGNGADGWAGQGTLASPYRLYWEGVKQRAVFAAGSIAALQDSTQAVTAEVWFKTGFSGPRPEPCYLLDWLQPPSPDGDPELERKGMSISIHNGALQIYQNGWVAAGTMAPDTWYHVAVVKAAGDLRVYVNGQRTYTGTHPHMGAQVSPLTIGCSVYRYYLGAAYGDYFNGSIAQASVWTGAMTDDEVVTSFRADSALYLPNLPPAPLARLVYLRADSASGTGPNPIPGAAGPWVDLTGNGHLATLRGITGADTASGWAGGGTDAAPYRLEQDGVDDLATIPAGSVPELQEPIATTTELWFKTGPDVASSKFRYLVEWLASIGSSHGLELSTRYGQLMVYQKFGAGWTPVAPVAPNAWYHAVVVKRPGLMLVYVNGVERFTSVRPTVGAQGTEIVIGGSTWRGTGVYGDWADGAIGQACIWQGAMDAARVLASFRADSARYFGPHVVTASAGAHGAIAPAGSVIVTHGADRAFTITPEPCYDVAGVTVDGVSVGAVMAYTLVGVREDHTIAATFALRNYTAAASAGSGGTISPSGDVAVGCGTSQAFTITPDGCHTIADLLVDGVSVGAVASHTINNVQAGHTIVATFALKSFATGATAGSGGSVSPSGNVSVACGASQTFTMNPAACHSVANVLVDGVSVGAVTSYTITDVQGPHTLAVSFVDHTPLITASAGPNGVISPAGTTGVGCGGDLALTITPDPWHHVADVLVDGVSVGPITSHTFTGVVADHTIHATFAIDQHALSTNVVGQGVVARNPDAASYAHGSSVELTAQAPPAWEFSGWSGDASGSANPVIVVMGGTRSVTATFTHVDLSPAAALITPNGGQTLQDGDHYSILWSASDDHGVVAVDLALSMDGGATWTPIAAGVPNSGSYAWTVPATASWDARVRVCASDASGQQTIDDSDTPFTIRVRPAKVLDLRADQASGTGPYPSPGNAGPWVDLAQAFSGALEGFAGTPESGWNGNGTPASPFRLQFEGTGESVAIPAGSIPQLQSPDAATTAIWFQSPTNANPSRYYYLLEWVGGDGGMSIAIHEDRLYVYLDPWVSIALLTPGNWHQVIVAKQPNQVRVYLDGVLKYTGSHSLFGPQSSGLVIGASTWQGPGVLGDFYRGAIAQVRVWRGALSDAEAHAAYVEDADLYFTTPLAVDDAPAGLKLLGCRPNPAMQNLRVAFSLPDAEPTTLELIDLAGRRVRGVEVGTLGAGMHSLDLGREGMPPAGCYWIRLTRGGSSLTSRVAVIR